MRNIKSKVLGITFAVTLGCACLSGCQDPQPEIPEEEITYTISLDNSVLSINRFEMGELNAEVKKNGVVVSFPQLDWSSENENVATVEDGIITPVDYGKTVISVEYENVSASCEVTIAYNGYVPTLEVAEEEIQLLVSSDPFKVNASVFYESATTDTSSAVITYAIAPTGADIATVSADGYVTAVGVGETTLTVSATWKGYGGIGMQKEVPVIVCGDVETRLLGGAEEIYLSDLTMEGQTFSNKTTFTAEVYDNLEKVESAEFTWVSTNEEVATVVNGVVTAVAEGETEIYAVYEKDESVFESEKATVKVILPIIDKTETLSFVCDQSNAEYNTMNAKAVFGENYAGEIVKVKAKGGETNLWTDNGLDAATLLVGENVLVVYHDSNYAFEVKTQVYTRIIKTKADLKAFGLAYAETADNTNSNATKNWHVIMENDVDYENANYCADAGYTTSDRWLGVFDGNGHTISNMTTNFGFFGWLGKGAELKNTGFVNTNKPSGYQGGLLCNQLYGTIDNCFVHANNVVINAKRTGGIANTVSTTGKISNCMAIVEFTESSTYADVAYNALAAIVEKESSVENTFAISATAQHSFACPDANTPKDDYMYRTVNSFKTACPDLNASEFDNYGDFWVMTKGVPMVEDYLEILQTLAIANGETDVQPGDTLPITTNFAGVSFALADEYEGVTISEDGLLCVAENAPNAEVVIKAVSPYSDDIYATKTISVLNLIKSEIEASLGEIVLNKDGVALTSDYTLSAANVNGPISKIQTAKTGAQIRFTANETTITLNNADVQSAIAAQDGGEFAVIIYTSTHKYQAKVTVVSLEISTKAGLDYFATTIYRGATNITNNDKTNGTYGVYVRLVADINYGGAEYPNDGNGKYADHNNYTWQGTFDGCGNVISNIGIRRGFFCVVGTQAEVKNLALTQVTNHFNYQFGVICNQVYGSIDNCFVQATITTTKAGAESATSKNRGGIFNAAYCGKDYSASITNCIAVVEFETEASNHYAIGRTIDGTSYGENATLENCYAISATTSNAVGASADGLYASADNFKTNVATLPNGFNSYWTYTESGLSFGGTQVLTFAQE